MPHRLALQFAALAGVALLLGGAAVAYVAYTDDGDPAQVVRAYFAALSAADAPRALSYGDLPRGPHNLLTSAALAEQQRIAPLTGFEVRATTRHGDRASVQVRYRLGFAGRPQDIGTTVGARRADGRWRLDRVAASTQLAVQQGAGRAAMLGGAVPASTELLFPGAIPIGFDTPYLQLDAVHDHVELADAVPRLDVQVEASASGSRAALAAVGAALRGCLAGRGPLTCPLPGDRYVPGSLRGSLPADFARSLTVSVLDSAAGVFEVTGSVRLRASYRRLDFDNVESAGRGSVDIPVQSAGYATAPLRMSWEQGLEPAGQSAVPAVAPGPVTSVPGPSSAPEYWFDSWDVPRLWGAGARGQGVTIAVIDTGVNAALPELRGRVLQGTDLGTGGDGQVDREVAAFGHGTAMASIMVGRPGVLGIRGLAPGAKVLPIAVPLAGTTDAERPDDLPAAVTYAADHGAKIISMSLGGTRTPGTDSDACPADEQAAVFHALRKGAIVLAAVGNTGPTQNTVEEPGVCLGVVSVGAVDAAGAVARFSGRQPYLTLVAPGVDVPSIGRIAGQAFSGSGTSQATALTAAAAALVWSKHPRLTNRQVVARLLATLDNRRTSIDPAYGYGELDAGRAVTAAVAADAPNPVFSTAEPFLRRAAAFGANATGAGGLGPAPQPATTRPRRTSAGFAVDSASRLTDTRVLLGGAIGLVGLAVALVALVALARRPRAPEPPPLGMSSELRRRLGRGREDRLAS